jgi:predicted Zn-dependent peptidase
MGQFVSDIAIPELEFRFPEISRLPISDRGELISLNNDFFPLSQIEIHFYAGEFQDMPTEVSTLLFAAWKLGGTKSLQGSKFLERIEFMGAKLSITGNYEKTILSLSYLSQDEDEIFSMLEEWLLNPILEDSNIATVRSQLKDGLMRRNDSVPGLGMRKAKEFAYQNHLRGRSPNISSLEKVTKNNLLSYHKRLIGAPKVNALLSGNSDSKKIQSKLTQLLSKTQNYKPLPYSDIVYEDWKKDFRKLSNNIVLVEKETNQSIIILTGVMPPHNHPDFYAIQLLNYILGGGGFNSYFMTEIRNNKGLAYSTTSHILFEKTHGLFLAYTLTKNESVGEVLQLMEKILSPETVNSIQEHELQRAKNSIVNQFVFLFENNQKILTNQNRFDDHDMPKGYLKKYRSEMEAVSLEDLRRVGRLYFNPDQLRTVITGPRSLENQLKKKIVLLQPEGSFN